MPDCVTRLCLSRLLRPGQQDGRDQLGDHFRAQPAAHAARGRGRDGGGGGHLAHVSPRRRRREGRRRVPLLEHEQLLGDGDRLAGEDGVRDRRQVRRRYKFNSAFKYCSHLNRGFFPAQDLDREPRIHL